MLHATAHPVPACVWSTHSAVALDRAGSIIYVGLGDQHDLGRRAGPGGELSQGRAARNAGSAPGAARGGADAGLPQAGGLELLGPGLAWCRWLWPAAPVPIVNV